MKTTWGQKASGANQGDINFEDES